MGWESAHHYISLIKCILQSIKGYFKTRWFQVSVIIRYSSPSDPEIPPIPDILSAGSLRPLNSAWAELSLGGGPPLYLDPGIVDLFHSILQSIQAADTEKMHGLLIVLIKLLWREM